MENFSDVSKIIEAGLEKDVEKVKAYSELLLTRDNLNELQKKIIRNKLDGVKGNIVSLQEKNK
jgi:hypothetical protein